MCFYKKWLYLPITQKYTQKFDDICRYMNILFLSSY